MNLRESIHNELLNIYTKKEVNDGTIEERYERYFKDVNINENIQSLGYFTLREYYHNDTLNEGLMSGIGNFFSGLFGNLGGNVEQQLKEWLIGKIMDWFLKPFIGKIGGEDGAVYEGIKKYLQITFAEMPFTEIASTVTNCDKMTRLCVYGLFEFLLANMLTKINLDGVIADTIRQELDRKFIEQSGFANKIASIIGDTLCGNSFKLGEKLKDFDLDFSFA